MSKISIYEVTPVPKLADKLIGTSVGGEPEDITYNFTLSELLNLFIPNIPQNTLQGVLDYGNEATQDIILNGTIYTTNLEVSDNFTILNSFFTGETHILGGLYDSLDSIGTPGQVLTSTGSGVEWYSIPTVIPDLQQVLTSGNTADVDVILDANLEAIVVSADTAIVGSQLSVQGVLVDYNESSGSAGQVLASNSSNVQWVDLPVYTATSPLSIDSITRVISIQQASASQNGYLSSLDWINFDGKQPAGNYITALTGEATASGPGSASVTLSTSAVTGKLLTGLNLAGGGTITATDSILQAFGKVQNQISGMIGGVTFQGTWNASTNTPTLTSSVGTKGYYYIVDVAGSTNLNGITDWQVGDWAIFNGIVWDKVDNTDAVSSVNGFTGAVNLTTANIPEVTNLYYLDSRARAAISLTTTGTSGAATYDNTTGVLNIPQYTEQFVGTVTSVAASITGNSIGITGSPITSSGTLAFAFAGNATQYVRGDGALATLPTNGGGGGASVSYYLNGSINQGTIGGVTYYEMNKTPIIGAGTDFSRNTDGYIASFLTDANDPALLNIPAGNFNFETYFEASSGGGSPTFYIELYKYDGTTFTLIASNSTNPKLINDGTNIEAYFSALAVPQTTLTLTDRLAIRIYVTTAGRTITLHTENGHLCQVITTFTTGLTALNGLTAQVQYLATGTSGTDFNIASATATHTFNLPTASATNRGALSSADWTTFNNKQNALTNPITGTGNSGQVAYFNGTNSITSGSSFAFDSVNNRLSIGGANTAGVALRVLGSEYSYFNGGLQTGSGLTQITNGLLTLGSGANALFRINGAATTNASRIEYQQASTTRWFGGINTNSDFSISTDGAMANGLGIFLSSRNVVIGQGTDAGFRLDVNGTARVQGQLTVSSGNSLRLFDAANSSNGTVSLGSTTQSGASIVNSWNNSYVFSWNNNGLNLIHAATGNNVIVFNRTALSSGTTSAAGLQFTSGGSFAPTTGTNEFQVIRVDTIYNATGGTNTIRGLFYNPTLTSLTGTTHIAIQTVSGDVLLGTTSGNVAIGTSTLATATELTLGGSQTASSAIARGGLINTTLVAAANNDVLVGLDINPTFTNGAFTGVQNLAARIQGNAVIGATAYSTMLYGEIPRLFVSGGTRLNGIVQIGTSNIYFNGNNIAWENTGITNNLPEWRADATGVKFGNYLSLPLRISIGGTENVRFFSTGNSSFGSGTDAGFRLDVNGTARVVNTLRVGADGVAAGRIELSRAAASATGFMFMSGNSFVIENLSTIIEFRTNGSSAGAITSTGALVLGSSAANASSVLDLQSTTRGFLPPRMTTTQKNAISSPATGLMVYDTTLSGIALYNGTNWQNVLVPNSNNNVLIGTTTDNGQGTLQNTGSAFLGGLQVGGLTFSTSTTATTSTIFYYFNGGSGQTLTLPSTVGISSYFLIKNAGTAALTISRSGSTDTIMAPNGTSTSTTISLAAGSQAILVSNGAFVWIQIV